MRFSNKTVYIFKRNWYLKQNKTYNSYCVQNHLNIYTVILFEQTLLFIKDFIRRYNEHTNWTNETNFRAITTVTPFNYRYFTICVAKLFFILLILTRIPHMLAITSIIIFSTLCDCAFVHVKLRQRDYVS